MAGALRVTRGSRLWLAMQHLLEKNNVAPLDQLNLLGLLCLLKGGPKCYALDGENQYHAVFTQGHKCVIVNPSTLAPALIAEVQGEGVRLVAIVGGKHLSIRKGRPK